VAHEEEMREYVEMGARFDEVKAKLSKKITTLACNVEALSFNSVGAASEISKFTLLFITFVFIDVPPNHLPKLNR